MLGALALGALAATVHAAEAPSPGRWAAGVGTGFLTSTPDGVEFALQGHADYFVSRRVSVGLLGQAALGGNDHLLGLSGQARYWWSLPGAGLRLAVQGGIGVVWADIEDSDSGVSDTYTSFLIPIGVGLEYAVNPRMAVTADFLLNFTSLGETVRVRGREFDLHTNVMPGFYLGVRF